MLRRVPTVWFLTLALPLGLPLALAVSPVGCSSSSKGNASSSSDGGDSDSGHATGCLSNCAFFADTEGGTGSSSSDGGTGTGSDGGGSSSGGTGSCCVPGDTQIGDAGMCGAPTGGPICCIGGTYTAANIASVNTAVGEQTTACCAGGAIGPKGGLTRSPGYPCQFFCDCDTSTWSGGVAILNACVGNVCGNDIGEQCGMVPNAPKPIPCARGTCQPVPGGGMSICTYGDGGGGGGAGTTSFSCTAPSPIFGNWTSASATYCALITVPSSQASIQEQICTGNGGTIVPSCPTDGVDGCCTFAGCDPSNPGCQGAPAGYSNVTCVYDADGGSVAKAQSDCTSNDAGTWSTTP